MFGELSEDFAALANWQLCLLFGNYERLITVKLAIQLFELKLKVIIGDEDNVPAITNLLGFLTFGWPARRINIGTAQSLRRQNRVTL